MLIVSFRDMVKNVNGAVTAGVAYKIDPVAPATVWDDALCKRFQLAGDDDTRALLKGKHVCFLVHGFNVDRDGGYTGLGALAQEMLGDGLLPGLVSPGVADNLLTAGVEVIVPVLWAGDWYLPTNYSLLLPDIRKTADYFAALIWSDTTQMGEVSFVTHSMGARVVMETVQRVVSQAKGRAIPRFNTAILTAGAIPDDCLDLPDFAAAVDAFDRFVVVSSRSDTVLSGDFPTGNLAEQALWANDYGSNRALGLGGPTLKPASRARAKTTWYEIPRTDFQRHNEYLPAPMDVKHPRPGYPNGWDAKRVRIGKLAQATFDNQPAPLPASRIR